MPREADMVAEISTTTGTGSMTLSGATAGHRSWLAGFGSANAVAHYGIVHSTNGTWESGIGTFLFASGALQRDTVLASSSGGSKVSFASGDKVVYCQHPAETPIRVQITRSTDHGVDVYPAASQSGFLFRGGTPNDVVFAVNANGRISTDGGLAVTDVIAPGGAQDNSNHIALWGTTYGFNITSASLNYNCASTAGHNFYVGSTRVGRFGTGGLDTSLTHSQDGGYFYIGAYSEIDHGVGYARLYYSATNKSLVCVASNEGVIAELEIEAGSFTGDGSNLSGVVNESANQSIGGIKKFTGTRLLIGDSAYTGTSISDVGASIQGAAAGTPGAISSTVASAAAVFLNRRSSNGNITEFYRQDAFIAAIGITTGAVTYNTTSDARRKENARDFDSGALVDALSMVEFDWKPEYGGGSAFGIRVDAATAAICPTAFTHDEEHDVWQADYSKLVPILWREIRELRARVAQLEA